MAINEARDLFIELRDHLKSHYCNALYYPYKNCCYAIEDFDADIDEADKIHVVRHYYNLLFPARGGMSDFVFWDEEPETRKALNEPVIRAKDELADMLSSEETKAVVNAII